MLASLIETCKLNAVEPRAYLATCSPASSTTTPTAASTTCCPGPTWPENSLRDKAAALRFIKQALKRPGSPKAITTDGLRSYEAAMKELGNAGKREVGRCANNRKENSHQPFRR